MPRKRPRETPEKRKTKMIDGRKHEEINDEWKPLYKRQLKGCCKCGYRTNLTVYKKEMWCRNCIWLKKGKVQLKDIRLRELKLYRLKGKCYKCEWTWTRLTRGLDVLELIFLDKDISISESIEELRKKVTFANTRLICKNCS